MLTCFTATNAVARNAACTDMLHLDAASGYFLAVAALLIASRYVARFI